MSKTILHISIILLIFSITSCASKRYAKQARKLDEAGLFREAAEKYYKSLVSNDKNIDALTGLQRSGQLVLQEKLDLFKTYYQNSSIKEAVYAFIDADSYYQKINSAGVKLIFQQDFTVYYKEVKEKYLSKRYAEGLQALDVEEFVPAESILKEIIYIDPNYKDSKTQWITAHYEPIYRKSNEFMQNNLNRKAYYSFNEITMGVGTYKDAVNLRLNTLNLATITIAIAPIYYPYAAYNTLAQTLKSKISNEINAIKSPFYQLITDDLITMLPDDGKKSLPAFILPYIKSSQNSFKAKTVLVGRISRFSEEAGKPQTVEKKGFLKYTEEYTTETGEKKARTIYDKVVYNEYAQSNRILLIFDYSLIDVKTGVLIVSDAITISRDDQLHYATYDGDIKKLVPGYWKAKDKESSEDVISDNQDKLNELKNLLNSKKDLKTTLVLANEAIQDISVKVATSIENYNPEK